MRNDQAHAHTGEVVEGRARAKGNAGPHTRGRTQRRGALSRALARGRQAAKARGQRLTALGHPVSSLDRLRAAYDSLTPDAAPGVEGQTGAPYGEHLASTRRERSDRWPRGASPAPPVERVSIPQAEGRQRPIGQPTLEATIVPRATVAVLNAISETECRGFADGARRGRRPPHAVDAVTVGMDKRHSNWGLDADMRGCDDALDHAWWVQLVAHRMGDQRVVHHIQTWLKAGGRADGHWRPQAAGTPQGGSARPLLATLSLP